jgi:hypothetical protein
MVESLEDHVAVIGSPNLNFETFGRSPKLETERGPQVESGDCRLGRLGSGMWQAGTSNAVAPACVG